MKCDLCDREFANSEELMRHKEQMHPMDEGEMPDMAPEKREDPAILGGLVTQLGDTVYDGSVRTQLQQLREELLSE